MHGEEERGAFKSATSVFGEQLVAASNIVPVRVY